MKHKLLKTLVVAFGLMSNATVFTNANQSQIVTASKSDDIFEYGFDTNHAEKYFKNWRKVVLLHDTEFDQSGEFFQPEWEYRKTYTLKKGTLVNIKYFPTDEESDYSPISYWIVSSKKFPKTENSSKIWYFNRMKKKFHNEQLIDALEQEVATTDSYEGLSTIFQHTRKVKVIKPVMAYKIKQEVPAYKNHIVGKTKIKKGTILKVIGPSNHWTLKVSGKGVREHYPYMWNVGKRRGWYKLID